MRYENWYLGSFEGAPACSSRCQASPPHLLYYSLTSHLQLRTTAAPQILIHHVFYPEISSLLAGDKLEAPLPLRRVPRPEVTADLYCEKWTLRAGVRQTSHLHSPFDYF